MKHFNPKFEVQSYKTWVHWRMETKLRRNKMYSNKQDQEEKGE